MRRRTDRIHHRPAVSVRAVSVRAVLLAGVAALVAAACVPPPEPDPDPGPSTGIGVRQVTIDLTGGPTYHRIAPITGGSVHATYDGDHVSALTGTAEFAGLAGGTATVSFALGFTSGVYSGDVSVNDPSAGVAATVTHTEVPVAFQDDSDASATTAAGGTTIHWSVDTSPAPGLEPELDALSAQESTFCRDAQRDLVGLTEAQLPVAGIANTVHTGRAAFVLSKPSISPLGVHTWVEPDMATTAAGNTVALSHRISCKTKSADKVVELGLPTTGDLACSTLTTRAVELARAAMTPAELAAYDTSGRQLALQPDRMAVAGPDWLAPFADEVVDGPLLRLTAGALLVNWNDPAYVALPESFRGVHYCTVWSPAWAYWWMTEGAFAP